MVRHNFVMSPGDFSVLVAAMGASALLISDGLLRIRAAAIA